jgi:hypothetical protein
MSVKNQFETLCAIEQISEKTYTRIAAQEISGTAPLEQELSRAMAAVATEIDRNVQCYSSLDWLLYLRAPVFLRLTSWLADGMETAHHAEAFTGHSLQETLGFSLELEGISPKWNSHRLRRGRPTYRRSVHLSAAPSVSIYARDGRDFSCERA